MKRVLITGANSFIGLRLCRKMAEEGWYIYAVVRENFKKRELFAGIDNLKVLYCDMESYSHIDKKFHIEELECAVLLSWNGTRGNARNDKQLQQTNVENTKEIVRRLISIGCKTIVTSGSQAEYGTNPTDKKVTEDFVCRPNTEYGKAKLELYEYLSALCKTAKVRLLEPRFFSLYGENDFEGTMIISILRNMLSGEECNLTECRQIWDFMYVDDAIAALYMLIENSEVEGVFNFGSGEAKPLREYVYIMRELTQSTSKINYGAVPYPKTGMVHTNPSIEKLRKFTGYTIQTKFEEGIKKIILREKQEGYGRKGTV